MLDNPKKTAQLMTELKAALPFNVELTPWLIKRLHAQHDEIANATEHVVSDLSYAGDEGGIVCHIARSAAREMLVVSLTHVLVPRSMPFAAAVGQYQKHRLKKLKEARECIEEPALAAARSSPLLYFSIEAGPHL